MTPTCRRCGTEALLLGGHSYPGCLCFRQPAPVTRDELVRVGAIAMNGGVERLAVDRWSGEVGTVVDAFLARYDIRPKTPEVQTHE